MRLGFLSNSMGKVPLDEALRRAAQVGAAGLEIHCESAQALSEVQPDELKSLARQTGLAIPSLCLAFICRGPALIGPPAETAKARKLIEQAIDLATHLEAGVLVVPFFGQSVIEVESQLNAAIDALLEIVDQAEEAGVVLGVESPLNFDQQQFLLNHFAHTGAVKVYHDTGNALARKLDLPGGIRQLGRDAMAGIHFKDVRIVENQPPDFNVPMGAGNVDFRATAQALQAIGYDGWVILETPPGDDPLASAKANLDCARSAISAAAVT